MTGAGRAHRKNRQDASDAAWQPGAMTASAVVPREITPLLIGVQSHPERDVSLETLAAEFGFVPARSSASSLCPSPSLSNACCAENLKG